jgi:hypothetical protein
MLALKQQMTMPHANTRDAFPQSGFKQSALPLWLIVVIVIAIVVVIAATVALYRKLGWYWWSLLRDPATAMGFSPTVGVFSHLGVLAMTMAGAVCIFGAVFLNLEAKDRPLLLYAGALTLWLGLDDLFMLHEAIFPRIFGIPEQAILAAYVALGLGLFWSIGRRLFSMTFLGLWIATLFLAVMLVTDLAFHVATSFSFLVEEVAKQCGWMLWAAFWISFAGQSAKRLHAGWQRDLTGALGAPGSKRGLPEIGPGNL